jgi:DNA-directed RNA polymerase sigma subunit (sigma70/sigma32)
MTGSLSWITDDTLSEEVWPTDEGWPYPDVDADEGTTEEPIDFGADTDDDLVSLHAAAPRLLDGLAPLERWVIVARYGLDGRAPRTMREIQHQLGLPRADLRVALGDGLTKLRARVG